MAGPVRAVIEPETKREFPSVISFQHEGRNYALKITGTAARKKYFFKIYGMAHYLEDTDRKRKKEEAFQEALTDGGAKQITIEYVREVGPEKIRAVLREGFQKNTTPKEFEEIRPLVDELCGYFQKPVKTGERFILRRLSGGKVVFILQDKEMGTARSPLFARALWSIWLGERSVVERDKLVEMIV